MEEIAQGSDDIRRSYDVPTTGGVVLFVQQPLLAQLLIADVMSFIVALLFHIQLVTVVGSQLSTKFNSEHESSVAE